MVFYELLYGNNRFYCIVNTHISVIDILQGIHPLINVCYRIVVVYLPYTYILTYSSRCVCIYIKENTYMYCTSIKVNS